MVLTEIEIFDIRILEPVTSLTDLITASVCYYSFYQLHKLGTSSRPLNIIKYYFLLLGFTTTCAALIGHAFLYRFSFDWKMIGWSFSAFGMLCMEMGSLLYLKQKVGVKYFKSMQWLIILQLVLFFITIFNPSTRSFNAVKTNSAIGLVLITVPFHYIIFKQFKNQGSKILMFGILGGILPAVVYNTEFTLHDYFNYHDISHILMAICTFVIFKGVYQLYKEEEQVKFS